MMHFPKSASLSLLLLLFFFAPGSKAYAGFGAVDGQGFTVFSPSVDTVKVYVSASVGNDTWSGLAPAWDGVHGPKATIGAGYAVLRDGFPDWLLLKRGDLWQDENLGPAGGGSWGLSGRSAQEPMVVGSYGSALQRPRLAVSAYQNVFGEQFLAITGLEFYAYKMDPNHVQFTGVDRSGLRLLGANQNILIEDTHHRYCGMIVQSYSGFFDKVYIRRNIIEHAYSVNSHMQGLFTFTGHPGLLEIEENVFDHNGWNDEFRLVLYEPEDNLALWQTLTDARFTLELAGQTFHIDGLDFSGAGSMDDVAGVMEAQINTAVGQINAVSLDWTQGKVFVLKSTVFGSSTDYHVHPYAGVQPGTDIHGSNWLNNTKGGSPESTIFNRSMYLSSGYGTTTVRGNIDANGASGGVQQRMGGLCEDNLFLRAPHAISFGHNQNPVQDVSGTIRNNVSLGSRDIDTQPQGSAIVISSSALTNKGGPSLIDNVAVYGNIIAHNTLGTANLIAIKVEGDGVHTNLEIYDNIVYNWTRKNWPNPNDHRAYGFRLNPVAGSVGCVFRDNVIQQPESGFIGSTNNSAVGISLKDNTYFSVEPDPPALWSKGWFTTNTAVSFDGWVAQTGEAHVTRKKIDYVDPNRTIETYMTSLGQTATYEAFMAEAKKQSKMNWRTAYTADAVNTYVRAGFVEAGALPPGPSGPLGGSPVAEAEDATEEASGAAGSHGGSGGSISLGGSGSSGSGACFLGDSYKGHAFYLFALSVAFLFKLIARKSI